MSKKLFVGNLPFDVNDADLVKVFSVVGKVTSSQVVTNHKSGRSKGFGFVEMETEELASQAVKTFEGATLNERAITVQLATPKVIAIKTADKAADSNTTASSITDATVTETANATSVVTDASADSAADATAIASSENSPTPEA